MINPSQYYKFNIFFLLLILLLFNFCDKEKPIPFCDIKFSVDKEVFFQGCTIPISFYAGEGTNKNTQVQLFINNEDMGLISTAPYIYYWETNDVEMGDQSIEAFYTSADNTIITATKNINLKTTTVNCPSSVTDIDSNIYNVVQIGNQCWMKENLKTFHYPDGEEITNGNLLNAFMIPWDLGGYFYYNNDINYVSTYGLLYTWYAAMNGTIATENDLFPKQGICPEGWHMPSVHEWRTMIDHSGGVHIAANKLKSTDSELWVDNLEATNNSSEFSALPGGCNLFNSSSFGINSTAYFHTSTETIPNHAYHILLKSRNSMAYILGHEDSKRFGYSVRCLKD